MNQSTSHNRNSPALDARTSADPAPKPTAKRAGEAIFAELKELREAVESSATNSTRITECLNRQNLAIVGIVQTLNELKEMIDRPPVAINTHSAESSLPIPTGDEEAVSQTTDEADSRGKTDWDEIRNAFLKKHAAEETPEASPIRTQEQPSGQTDNKPVTPENGAFIEAKDGLDRILEQFAELTEVTSDDSSQLRAGIVARDRLLAAMAGRLQKQIRSHQTLSPEQLAELTDRLPEQLAGSVTASLEVLNQQIRLGELELSLERARISRQLRNLEDSKELLEGKARSCGLRITQDGGIDSQQNQTAPTGTKGRRWLGALGFGD